MNQHILRTAVLALLLPTMARADVRLPAIFSDHAVLQAERDIPLWGWADPGEEVSVEVSWATGGAVARADETGRFEVTLRTPAPGGPRSITVRGGNELRIEDVLVGEVWLCSGQSNMEMSVSHVGTFGVVDEERELAEANWPDIRLFLVKNAIAPAPLAACSAKVSGARRANTSSPAIECRAAAS